MVKHFVRKEKNIFLKITKSLLLSFIIIWQTGCKVDVKNYLKDYTEIAAITDTYETSLGNDFAAYRSGDFYCIPSSEDFTITFELRNPQHYEFSFDKSMKLTFPDLLPIQGLGEEKIIEPRISHIPPSDNPRYVLLRQENNLYGSTKALINSPQALAAGPSYYLTLTYSKDFLREYEMGHNISPTIELRHPATDTYFSTFNSLKLVCNSAPPSIFSPVVYQTDDDIGNYVLIFNMPSQGLLSGIHRDITKLVISTTGDKKENEAFEYIYPVQINMNSENTEDPTNGTFSFGQSSSSSPELTQEDPTITALINNTKIIPSSATFEQKGQPVYLKLNHKLSDEDITYTFTLKDNYGLTNKVEANVQSKRLSDIYVTNKESILLNGGEEIEQDEGSSFATINFIPALTSFWFSDENNMIQNKYSYETDELDENLNPIKLTTNFHFDETKIDDPKSGTNIDKLSEEDSSNITNKKGTVKIRSNGNYTDCDPAQTTEIINSWDFNYDNTSDVQLVYALYQGIDDTGKSLGNGEFSCIKSYDSDSYSHHPKKQNVTINGKDAVKLDITDNELSKEGHYLSMKLPAGDIFVRVYAHKKGFADTATKEFTMSILKTRLYVANSDSGGNDKDNNGSENSAYLTVTKAAQNLSKNEDKNNTIYLQSDIKDNIVIPDAEENDDPHTSKDETKKMYVTITSADKSSPCTITPENPDTPVLTIPDDTIVILDNINLSGSDIVIGKGSTLYMNDVKFSEGIIHVPATSQIVLGGNTVIGMLPGDIPTDAQNPITPKDCYVEVYEETFNAGTDEEEVISGKIQLGSNDTDSPSRKYIPYTSNTSPIPVIIKTGKKHPKLNVVILECEDDSKTIQVSYPNVFTDLTTENQADAYKLFKLDIEGYYIGYDEEKPGSSIYGKAIIKIPAAFINEPEIGDFKVSLVTAAGTSISPNEYGVYEYTNSYSEIKDNKQKDNLTDIYIKIERFGKDITNVVTNKKIELLLEGDVIATFTDNNEIIMHNKLTIPVGYPDGKYSINVYYTYDRITYSENFTIKLKEASK